MQIAQLETGAAGSRSRLLATGAKRPPGDRVTQDRSSVSLHGAHSPVFLNLLYISSRNAVKKKKKSLNFRLGQRGGQWYQSLRVEEGLVQSGAGGGGFRLKCCA